MVHALLAGEGVKSCLKLTDALIYEHPKFQFNPYPGRASGYIVDTMQTVLHCFYRTDNFEGCVTQAVNCGEDADTNGAICGMLAGALYGIDAIPKRWLSKLEPAIAAEIHFQATRLIENKAV